MVKKLTYATDCAKQYSSGKELDYIMCILTKADQKAAQNSRGSDKHVVRRATKALIDLQLGSGGVVSGVSICGGAGFHTYNGPNDGLWPWLGKYGGIAVVVKLAGRKYRIVDTFRSAMLSKAFRNAL